MLINKLRNFSNKSLNVGNMNWSDFFQTIVSDEDMLKESTYNKCIKFNAESVAKCPLVVKEFDDKEEKEATNHKYYEKLRLRPNKYMNINECLKTFIALGEHEGISALYITNNNELYPARINQILVSDKGVFDNGDSVGYELDICGHNILALDSQCVIYRSCISWDGIRSVHSNKEYLNDSVQTTMQGQKYLSKLFNNGMCSKVLVQVPSDISNKAELKKQQDKFNSLFNTDGRMFVAPYGTQISSLNMTLADSQFKDIRSLSRIEIANAFGLSPSMIGEGDNKNYENDTFKYLQDTLLYKLQSLEQEFDYKLLTKAERKKYKIRFNTNVLLRTNAKVQQEILCSYRNAGIYTTNQCLRILGLPTVEGGDVLTVPSGEMTIEQLINGQASWQQNNNNDNNNNNNNNDNNNNNEKGDSGEVAEE